MLYGRRLFELLSQPWDLVHCWESRTRSRPRRSQSGRPPTSRWSLHLSEHREAVSASVSWIERRVLERADGLVAFGRTVFDVVTPALRSLADVRDPARRRHGPVCPDPEARRQVRAERRWRDDLPVVGFLGRFVPEKGVMLLADVLDRVTTPWRALFVARDRSSPICARGPAGTATGSRSNDGSHETCRAG